MMRFHPTESNIYGQRRSSRNDDCIAALMELVEDPKRIEIMSSAFQSLVYDVQKRFDLLLTSNDFIRYGVY